jgi:hypothetical protein
MKLTKVQKEVLTLLDSGEILEVDSMNLSRIGDRDVAFSTRTFLTEKRLVTRKDKSKAVTTKGNGFVISEKGKQALRGEL